METIRVKKSNPLHGTIRISGAKNSVLPILAATLLTDKECIIHEVPKLEDVQVMYELLKNFGAEIEILSDKSVKIQTKEIISNTAPYELINKMRASFLVMGPLLSRTHNAIISMPGGCAIGSRPIDLHLKGFESLNASINSMNGFISAKTDNLIGNVIYLDFPSVGATENIIMAACMADGVTILENAAEEPEIKDLADFINSMGGKIEGSGSKTIKITGVKELSGTEYKIIPDRIEAGTYMIAALITGGQLKLENINSKHLQPIIAKLKESGALIEEKGDSLIVKGNNKLKCCNIKTLPYPGFPTDMQAQFMIMLSKCNGVSTINESIFENRFMHVDELKRLGAKIKIQGHTAIIEGTKKLYGAKVKATDLRAGAALILAGLISEGETVITDIYHIKRGYDEIVEKLKSVGADICYSN